jgi:hypothetical protein
MNDEAKAQLIKIADLYDRLAAQFEKASSDDGAGIDPR